MPYRPGKPVRPVRPRPPINKPVKPLPPAAKVPKPVAKPTAKPAAKPVVSGISKNIGEKYSYQQTANGNRYQKAPVNKAKGLSGQLVTSTAAERASLPARSRLNALNKRLGK